MHDPRSETKTCEDFGRLLMLYVWEELDTGERAAVEDHVGKCAICAAALAAELRLRQGLAGAEQPAEKLDPSSRLLAQCRSELAEALDDAGQAPARTSRWGAWHLASWFVFHPALSAALLVLLGVAFGSMAPQWYRSYTSRRPETPFVVSASPKLSEQDLQTMGIAGINVLPDSTSGSPSVELHLTAEKPLVVRGSLDDSDVKRVLTFVVLNSQRFDSGVRLDSVDVLRTRSADTDVRHVLCAAAHRDRNPGVRLRALEALRGFEQDDSVRQTLVEALQNDSNPGVRVEAVNSLLGALRAAADQGGRLDDQRVVEVLRDRMEKDSNNYIRMQSAAAIRQLGPRKVY